MKLLSTVIVLAALIGTIGFTNIIMECIARTPSPLPISINTSWLLTIIGYSVFAWFLFNF